MMDPKRIDRILDKVRTVWEAYPDLRLFQLLGNNFTDKRTYYVEDDELEQALDNDIEHIKKKPKTNKVDTGAYSYLKIPDMKAEIRDGQDELNEMILNILINLGSLPNNYSGALNDDLNEAIKQKNAIIEAKNRRC